MELSKASKPARTTSRKIFNVEAVRKHVLDPRAEHLDLRPILLAACEEIKRLRSLLTEAKRDL